MKNFSRSQYDAYQDCARKGWWLSEYPSGGSVNGLQRKSLRVPLLTGGLIHDGIGMLLLGKPLEDTVKVITHTYDESVKARGFTPEDIGESPLVAEQRAFVEAWVRAYARVRLEPTLAEFEVLDVEREEVVPLSADVTLLARCDAVLRRKEDDAIFIKSFKTTSDARWLDKEETSLQSMSEVLAVEARLGVRTVSGVLVEGLLKGRRVHIDKMDKSKGKRETSPLIYGYKLDANPPFNSTTYSCDPQSARRKGWKRFEVWNENFEGCPDTISPIAYWVRWLGLETVEGLFVNAAPILRQGDILNAWKQQANALMTRLDLKAKNLRLLPQYRSIMGEQQYYEELNADWPQNYQACARYGSDNRCQFFDICFTKGVGEDPLASGLYMPREAHHSTEAKPVEVKG